MKTYGVCCLFAERNAHRRHIDAAQNANCIDAFELVSLVGVPLIRSMSDYLLWNVCITLGLYTILNGSNKILVGS